MTDRHRTRLTTALATPLAVLTLLTGCTGASGSDAGDKADAGPSVIAPGKPGEAARTLSPDEAERAGRAETEPNAADFAFMTMMIRHHQQALVMTELAEKHAENGQVKKLADRIKAAQAPEIKAMQGWLKRNEANKPKDSGHHGHDGHGTMRGMATDEQLDELRAARGEQFDKLFLSLMITHHEGAVTMSKDVLSKGTNVTVEETATEIAGQQTVEIARMRKLM